MAETQAQIDELKGIMVRNIGTASLGKCSLQLPLFWVWVLTSLTIQNRDLDLELTQIEPQNAACVM